MYFGYLRYYHEGKLGEGYVGTLNYFCNFLWVLNAFRLKSYVNDNNQQQLQ